MAMQSVSPTRPPRNADPAHL